MQQISRWQPRPSGPRSASGVRSGHTRRSRETATGQVVREGRGVRPSASHRRNIIHGRNCACSHLALQPRVLFTNRFPVTAGLRFRFTGPV